MKKYTPMVLLHYPDISHDGRNNWYTGAVIDGLSVFIEWRVFNGRPQLIKFDSVGVDIMITIGYNIFHNDSVWPYLFSINADCRSNSKEKLEFMQYNDC